MARSKHFEEQLGGMSESEKTSLLAGLSPEEIAGLQGGDDLNDEIMFDPKAKVDKSVSMDEDDAEQPEVKPEPKAKKKPKEEPKAEPEAEIEDDTEEDDADLEELPEDGEYEEGDEVDAEDGADDEEDEDTDPNEGIEIIVRDGWKPPVNAAADREKIKDAIAALTESFDNGDLTSAQFKNQLTALNDQDAIIRETVKDAKTVQLINENEWFKGASVFLKANPILTSSEDVYNQMNAEVKRLQEASDNPFDPQILIKARDTLFARAEAITGKAPDGKKGAKASEPEKRKVAKRGTPPPSLSGKPVSDTIATENSAHQALNRMTTEAREAAMARMSAADLDSYLAGN